MAIDFKPGNNTKEGLEANICAGLCEETVAEYLYAKRKYFSLTAQKLICVTNLEDTWYDRDDILKLRCTVKEIKGKKRVFKSLKEPRAIMRFIKELDKVCVFALENNLKVVALID